MDEFNNKTTKYGVVTERFNSYKLHVAKKGDAYLLLLMHEAASLSSDDFAAKTLLPEFLEIIHPRDIARLYKMLLLTFAPDASVKFKKAKTKDSKPEQEQEQEAERRQLPAGLH